MLSGNLSRLLTSKEQFVLAGLGAAIVIGCLVIAFTRDAPHTEGAAVVAPMVDAATANPAHVAPPPPPRIDATIPPSLPQENTTLPKQVAVAISGAIRTPGVYTLNRGARVQDLVDEAGGLLDEADTSDINLAATLLDGSALTIPAGAYSSTDGGRLVVKGAPRQVVRNPLEYTISGWGHSQQAHGTRHFSSTQQTSHMDDDSKTNGLIDLNTASQEQLETLPGIGAVKAQEIIKYRSQQPFNSVDDLDNVHGIGLKTLENLRPLVTVSPV
ncbi:MAG: hypothetical protein AMXMBFR82_17130 [Candidatus Hydrogenedentota bacterium]